MARVFRGDIHLSGQREVHRVQRGKCQGFKDQKKLFIETFFSQKTRFLASKKIHLPV